MANRKFNENIRDNQEEILAMLDKDSQEDLFRDIPQPRLVYVNHDETADNREALNLESDLNLETGNLDQISNVDNQSSSNSDIQSTPKRVLSSYSALDDEDENDCEIIDVPAKRQKVDPRGRGRIMDKVWDEFQTTQDQTPSKVTCRHCREAVSRKVERLRIHLQKCSKYGASVSGRKSVPEVSETLTPPQHSPSAQTPPGSSSSFIRRRTDQRRMTSFVDRASQQEQDDMNMEVGRYIYTMNLPFSHVEHPAFRRMFYKIRPAYTPPCRQTVGGPILEKTYSIVKQEQEKSVKGKYAVVLQDGWKTRTSEPVIAHSIVTGGKSMFLNAISTEHNKKTSSYCFNLLAENIGKVNDMGAKVIAVVTDNCSSMEKLRRIVGEHYPDIFTYGCHAHLLNLIGKKLTPEDVMEKVQKVHNFFRNHDSAGAVLKAKKVGRPVIPNDTRWSAWQKTFEYYLKHQASLLEVSRDPLANITDTEVIEILNDGEFYNEVRDTVKRMKPIQIAIDKVQKEGATLADGVEEWIKLRQHLAPELGDDELRNYFEKQFNRAVQPVGLAAHMFHPTYRGNNLDPDLLQKGNTFLSGLNPFFVIVAAQLRLKSEDYFPKEMFMDKALGMCSAATWWSSQKCFSKVSADVCELGIKLANLPAGSADIERHFSTLGNIMGVRRCRLGVEKASKLCVIYKYYNSSAPPSDGDYDWAEEEELSK